VNSLTVFGSERQYKRRIGKWGLDKNVKKSEMRAIVRKQQSRIGDDKESAFRVRGREVEPLKIQRWMKQHGQEDALSPSPSSPRPGVYFGLVFCFISFLPPSAEY
jgi:hypothetical protein